MCVCFIYFFGGGRGGRDWLSVLGFWRELRGLRLRDYSVLDTGPLKEVMGISNGVYGLGEVTQGLVLGVGGAAS